MGRELSIVDYCVSPGQTARFVPLAFVFLVAMLGTFMLGVSFALDSQ